MTPFCNNIAHTIPTLKLSDDYMKLKVIFDNSIELIYKGSVYAT